MRRERVLTEVAPHDRHVGLAGGWRRQLTDQIAVDHLRAALAGDAAARRDLRAVLRSPRLLVATLGLLATIAAVGRVAARDDGPGARRIAAAVAQHARGGCPYVFIGDTITVTAAITELSDHKKQPEQYGYVHELVTVTNQRAETVMVLTHLYLTNKRPMSPEPVEGPTTSPELVEGPTTSPELVEGPRSG